METIFPYQKNIVHDNKSLHNTLETIDAKMEFFWLKCHIRKIKKIEGYIVYILKN